jgi:hypothetical protein
MSTVTEYLTKIVQKNLDEFGIVVWYDPKGSYQSFIEKFPLDSPLLKYDGSYFAIRHALEPFLESKDRQKVLVYVQQEHNESASPLIEAEYCGTILKPGGPTGKNTKLEIIARNALGDLFDAATIVNFEKSIQQEQLTLEDLDKLAESHEETGKAGSLQLIFGNSVPTEIVLAFLSDPTCDEKIEEKSAFEEFKTFISAHTGLDSQTEDITTYRQDLARYVLLTDFLAKIKDAKKLTTLGKVPQGKKKGHIEFCKNCVKEWQCRRDLQESYILISDRVDEELDISSLDFSILTNLVADTFPGSEKLATDCCIVCIDSGDFKTARKIIDVRKTLFWSVVDYKNFRLLWNILSYITDLNSLSDTIKQELKVIGKLTPAKIIEKYTSLSNQSAWFRLDLTQRHMEGAYADYEDPQSGDDTPLAALMIKTRNNYSETTNLIAEAYSDILEKNKFSYKGVLTQREIFSKILSPHLLNGKTVYFLVDALRYEMGVDLFNSLPYDDKKIQYAIATAPTVTPVGMAALMPQAETSFGIEMGGGSSIGIRINDTLLKTRDDRIEYLRKIIPQKTLFLKLDETLKITKANEKRIKNADLIVVTTQEIDDFSTFKDNRELVRHIMSVVLGQIKRAINNLAQLEIQNFVITADHGHIFGENIGSENKIPSPGGDIQYIDRRSWIGQGGEKDDAYMRVNPDVFDIRSEYEFAFPKNIACFKSKGDLVFFHGGLSLQESVIPVIEIVTSVVKDKSPEKGLQFSLSYPKEKISNRFFSIEVSFDWRGILVGPDSYIVRIEFEADEKPGKAVSASYGFNENTSEISLKKNESCHVTLMVPEGISPSMTTIYLIDSGTGKELAKIENLKISLSI